MPIGHELPWTYSVQIQSFDLIFWVCFYLFSDWENAPTLTQHHQQQHSRLLKLFPGVVEKIIRVII